MFSRIWMLLFIVLLIAVGWYMSEKGFYRGSGWVEPQTTLFGIVWWVVVIIYIVSAIYGKIKQQENLIKRERGLYTYIKQENIPAECVIHSSDIYEALAINSEDKVLAYIITDEDDGEVCHYLINASDVIKSEVEINTQNISSVICNGSIPYLDTKTHANGNIQRHISKQLFFKGTNLTLYTKVEGLRIIRLRLIPDISHLLKSQNSIRSTIIKANQWQNIMSKLD